MSTSKKITKKEFLSIFKSKGFTHLLPFLSLRVDLDRKLIVLDDGTIRQFPTTQAGVADLYPLFCSEVSEEAHPLFSKGGRYARHYGEPITVELAISASGYVSKKGFTATGRMSSSYVVKDTLPKAYEPVDITDFRIQ